MELRLASLDCGGVHVCACVCVRVCVCVLWEGRKDQLLIFSRSSQQKAIMLFTAFICPNEAYLKTFIYGGCLLQKLLRE